jgi:hypothetical protein
MNEQRERFEAWAAGRFELHWHVDAERYASAITQAAWEAWQAACPEGWKVAPVEPTQEMQNHGSVARYHERLDCKGLYKAMLSTAPKPEDACKSPG